MVCPTANRSADRQRRKVGQLDRLEEGIHFDPEGFDEERAPLPPDRRLWAQPGNESPVGVCGHPSTDCTRGAGVALPMKAPSPG